MLVCSYTYDGAFCGYSYYYPILLLEHLVATPNNNSRRSNNLLLGVCNSFGERARRESRPQKGFCARNEKGMRTQ